MIGIDKIVNLLKHPIVESNNYINRCHNKLKKESVLKLDNFLTDETISILQNEAKTLHGQAYYCSQFHTILLNKKDKKISDDDPCNIEVKSDKGCVPHDLIPSNSFLNQIYQSNEFREFIKKVLGVKNIYPYKDNLSSINYNYYEKSQQLGWHYDDASFAITLMIDSPDKGGVFQYITRGRDYENNFIDKNLIRNVMKGNESIDELKVKPGSLILFYGRNYLHRVTPVESNKGRVLVTLNYNLEEGIELSKNARKTFFGRTD
jgi:hypothetical protein